MIDICSAPEHPLAYQPFGAGPRTCIGMRFALLEIKICLAHLLHTFTLNRCDKTQVPIKLVGTSTVSPEHVFLILNKI